jgi:CheY-like chemotaxis protein
MSHRTPSYLTMTDTVVLLADDADTLRVHQTAIPRLVSGMRLVTATSGIEAMAKAQELRPHVIVLDAGLPGLDPARAVRRLRGDPATSRIPLIALSASARESEQLLRLGYLSCLPKPCLTVELVGAVLRALSSPRAARPVERRARGHA